MAAITISIWGRNNCGKTVLALNLAAYLAQNHNKLVGLVSAADYAELPAYLNLTFPAGKGMKAAKDAAVDHIKNFYVEADKTISGLYLLSPAPNGDAFDLADFDKAMGRRIIQESQEVFDVVVVDCTTDKKNAVTGEAIALSDAVVIPVDDNVGYPQWFSSNSRLFDTIKRKTFFVESKFNANTNMQAIFASMGIKQPTASIQYMKNAAPATNEGIYLFRGGKENKIYERSLSSLWEAIRNGR